MTRDKITHKRVTRLLLNVMKFTYDSDAVSEAEKQVLDDIRARLAALAEPDAKREPATAAEIVKAGGECAVVDDEYLLDFRDGWRAAERHHGIRKEDGK